MRAWVMSIPGNKARSTAADLAIINRDALLLALVAALYRTENMNEFTLLDAAISTYSQLGKRRVQGILLGMVGQLTRNWQVIAGTATMKATVLEGTTASNAAGTGTCWSPELTATLWTSYKASDKVNTLK